jgi:hypothetical protein
MRIWIAAAEGDRRCRSQVVGGVEFSSHGEVGSAAAMLERSHFRVSTISGRAASIGQRRGVSGHRDRKKVSFCHGHVDCSTGPDHNESRDGGNIIGTLRMAFWSSGLSVGQAHRTLWQERQAQEPDTMKGGSRILPVR